MRYIPTFHLFKKTISVISEKRDTSGNMIAEGQCVNERVQNICLLNVIDSAYCHRVTVHTFFIALVSY